VTQTRRSTSKRRKAGELSADRQGKSDTPSVGRRFTPARKSTTEGGTVYGNLVAHERGRLGLSQKELAARIRTSPATISRIEQGHPPGTEVHRRLTEWLGTEQPNGLARRLASSVPMRRVPAVARGTGERTLRPSLPTRLTLSSRRLWGALAIAFAVVLLAVIGSRLLSGDGAPARQPSVQVSSALGAPASIHKARVEARKEAAAEARRAAQEARERERAAAAAAAAAAARKAKKAAAAEQNSSADSQPAAPVESSPSPPSGSGGSNGPAPEIQHGIGSGGGLSGG
jgi:transcriptional regulator with XRE-family HTH domain